MTETFSAKGRRSPSESTADLRRTGINPDFWYPVAVSASLQKGKTVAASFAGGADRAVPRRWWRGLCAGDRCAHRQVPLSMGVVEGDTLRCCYRPWAYRGNGRIWQIPYLPKGAARPPCVMRVRMT